jgi:hypothetical protein
LGARFSYQVSFRAQHESMPVACLEVALPAPVMITWTAGEPRRTPGGDLLDGLYRESYCACDVGRGDDGALARLLDRTLAASRCQQDVLRGLVRQGASFAFFVSWTPDGDSGETFDSDLLSRMGELGISLELNVIP